MEWNNKQPIYQQLKAKIIQGVLNGAFKEGESVPSIRQVAEEYQLNPLTVSKAYQILVDEDIIEKQRGLGMFVKADTRQKLQLRERERFLQEEWPSILQQIQQLGIDQEELFK